MRMTLNAVNSFISTTPHIRVGLLFPQGYDETIVTKQVAGININTHLFFLFGGGLTLAYRPRKSCCSSL